MDLGLYEGVLEVEPELEFPNFGALVESNLHKGIAYWYSDAVLAVFDRLHSGVVVGDVLQTQELLLEAFGFDFVGVEFVDLSFDILIKSRRLGRFIHLIIILVWEQPQ